MTQKMYTYGMQIYGNLLYRNSSVHERELIIVSKYKYRLRLLKLRNYLIFKVNIYIFYRK